MNIFIPMLLFGYFAGMASTESLAGWAMRKIDKIVGWENKKGEIVMEAQTRTVEMIQHIEIAGDDYELSLLKCTVGWLWPVEYVCIQLRDLKRTNPPYHPNVKSVHYCVEDPTDPDKCLASKTYLFWTHADQYLISTDLVHWGKVKKFFNHKLFQVKVRYSIKYGKSRRVRPGAANTNDSPPPYDPNDPNARDERDDDPDDTLPVYQKNAGHQPQGQEQDSYTLPFPQPQPNPPSFPQPQPNPPSFQQAQAQGLERQPSNPHPQQTQPQQPPPPGYPRMP